MQSTAAIYIARQPHQGRPILYRVSQADAEAIYRWQSAKFESEDTQTAHEHRLHDVSLYAIGTLDQIAAETKGWHNGAALADLIAKATGE
jgi:hypothetical protein